MTDAVIVDLAVKRLIGLCRDADPDLEGLLKGDLATPRKTLLKVLDDLAENDTEVLSQLMRAEIVRTARLPAHSENWEVSKLVMAMIRAATVAQSERGVSDGHPSLPAGPPSMSSSI